jgi:hypothetical protein
MLAVDGQDGHLALLCPLHHILPCPDQHLFGCQRDGLARFDGCQSRLKSHDACQRHHHHIDIGSADQLT